MTDQSIETYNNLIHASGSGDLESVIKIDKEITDGYLRIDDVYEQGFLIASLKKQLNILDFYLTSPRILKHRNFNHLIHRSISLLLSWRDEETIKHILSYQLVREELDITKLTASNLHEFPQLISAITPFNELK